MPGQLCTPLSQPCGCRTRPCKVCRARPPSSAAEVPRRPPLPGPGGPRAGRAGTLGVPRSNSAPPRRFMRARRALQQAKTKRRLLRPGQWYRELARNEEYNTIWRDLNNSHTAGVPRPNKAQGWPKLYARWPNILGEIALLEAWSWPRIWANPVTCAPGTLCHRSFSDRTLLVG
jgi:hypothetical protein